MKIKIHTKMVHKYKYIQDPTFTQNPDAPLPDDEIPMVAVAAADRCIAHVLNEQGFSVGTLDFIVAPNAYEQGKAYTLTLAE